MPGATPRLPELYQPLPTGIDQDFHVSEFATDHAGAMSPFGPDVEFPLPLERLNYRHPTRAEWPNRPVTER
jgi:succinate dehydrogenase / fumarate reductase, iron-sulfur subunit